MTSIEFLKAEYIKRGDSLPSGVFEDAKEMHKAEMIKFANDFWNWAKGGDFDISDAEQYYQETFKKH